MPENTLDISTELTERSQSGGERALVILPDGSLAYIPFDVVTTQLEARMDEIRGLVSGKLAYQTKQAMIDAGAPPNGELAVVWEDPVINNNGEYGWDGSSWVESAFGFTNQVKQLEHRTKVIEKQPGLVQYMPESTDLMQTIMAAYVGQELKTVLGHDDAGRLQFDTTEGTAKNILHKAAETMGFKLANYYTKEGYKLAILTDESPSRVLASVDETGTITAGGSSFSGLNLLNSPMVYHIVNDGQSQSLGSTATPVLTEPGSIDGYLMPQGDLKTLSDFYPLKSGGENNLESPASGIVSGLIKWLRKNKDISVSDNKMRFAASCPGVGGTEIFKYVPGGVHYDRFFDQVYGMKAAAEKDGYQYQIHAFTWSLGGTDMNNGTTFQSYYDDLLLLRSDRESKLGFEFGFPVKLHCITWQNGARVANGGLRTLSVPNAQWYASKNVPEIHVCCPYYQFKFNDSVHLTNLSSKALGYYMQRVYREVVLLGNTWKPLQPEAITASGQTVSIEYHIPEGPLVFDRDTIEKTPANEGFRVIDDTGELTITAIRIVAGRKVEIDVAEAIGANPRLSYAEVFSGSGYAPNGDHPRGTLRDSAGLNESYEEYEHDDNGKPYTLELHNFCVTFNEPINID